MPKITVNLREKLAEVTHEQWSGVDEVPFYEGYLQ